MNSLVNKYRRVVILMFGIGLAWIINTPDASVLAQNYAFPPDGELIPPLMLSEEDFKQGFNKTYKIPNFPEDLQEEGNSRTGTISLSYTPGEVAPIRAVINFNEKVINYDEDGRKYFCTFSINWSGDLEPTDDDPEGKLPAQAYDFNGDIQGMQCKCRGCESLPNPGFVFNLNLIEEADGKIYRIPYVRFTSFESCLCKDPENPTHEPGHWDIDYFFGPEPSEGTEEKDLTLEGCADLLKGGEGQLDAGGKSEGGEYKWSTDSSSVMTVSGSGSSATISGKSTGRTVVRVEYENEDGEMIKAEKSGSVVELRSVNNGAAVPQIPMIDENGTALPPIEVPVDQDPGEGDLLTFAVADPGVATVFNLGSTLQIQGIRKGTTTAQAQTNCGEKTGPVINLEVVYCNEKTVQKLREELRMIKARLDAGRKQMAEITGDEEFERASKEGPEDIKDLAKSTAELISSTMGVAGKASKAAETADNLWGLFNTFNDFATGMAAGDMDKVGQATFDATVQVLDLTLVGLAKTAQAAGSAASKVGRDLGALCGTADRIKEIEEVTKESLSKLEDVERRLYKVCQEKSATKKEPSPSPEPSPSTKQSPAPKPQPKPEPTDSKTELPQDQGQEPSTTSDKGETKTGGGEPPVSPPTKTGGGSGGLALDCGCDNWKDQNNDLAKLAKYMNITVQCVENFESNLLPGFQNDLNVLSSALKGVSGASSLPEEEMKAKCKEYLTKTNGMVGRIEKFSEEAESFRSSLEGCDKADKQAVETIRKGAADTEAEMIKE